MKLCGDEEEDVKPLMELIQQWPIGPFDGELVPPSVETVPEREIFSSTRGNSPSSGNETFKEGEIRTVPFEKCPPQFMEVWTRCHC